MLGDGDLAGCVRALAAVHAVDGYPTVWPVAPAAWLSPPCLTRAWVAGHRGDVAGHVAMVRGADEPAVTALTGTGPDGLARVTRLFVAPAARGRRLGARLLDAVRDHAGELGLVPVLDVVDDGGAAVALYDRLGWRLVDRRPADWTTPAGVRLPVRLYLAPGSPST